MPTTGPDLNNDGMAELNGRIAAFSGSPPPI